MTNYFAKYFAKYRRFLKTTNMAINIKVSLLLRNIEIINF